MNFTHYASRLSLVETGNCKDPFTATEPRLFSLHTAGIRAEHLEKGRHFLQIVQGVAAAFLMLTAGKVDVEQVLPALALQGPRFDLGQVDVPQGKNRQTLEQRAG